MVRKKEFFLRLVVFSLAKTGFKVVSMVFMVSLSSESMGASSGESCWIICCKSFGSMSLAYSRSFCDVILFEAWSLSSSKSLSPIFLAPLSESEDESASSSASYS